MEAMNILRFLSFFATIIFIYADDTCYISDESVHGDATFYDWASEAAAGSGSCGYDVTGTGMEIAAIEYRLYAGSKSCGMCIEVTGPTGDTLDVIVVDQCMTCSEGSLDLSQPGFNSISGGRKGMVPITWKEIECPVDNGFAYIFVYANENAGTPFQMRIFNHRHKISKVERKQPDEGDDADWFDLPRGNNGNYGVPKGHRKVTKPFQVRLTSDVTGAVTTETLNQNPKNGVRELIVGTRQFPSLCASSGNGGDGDNGENGGSSGNGTDGSGNGSGNANHLSAYVLITSLIIVSL